MLAPVTADSPTAIRLNRPIAVWLLCICALIFGMVVLGGVTRLTESGLSITEWKPVTGVIPPLSAAEWQAAFDKYKQIPEFRLVHSQFQLADFKGIFWFEWSHRLLGRLIGLAFLVPLVVFAARGRISRGLLPKLALLFVLGGLQGALGWYMVASGLSVRTDVSQYRLTAHLGAAFILYGAIFWIAMGLIEPRARPGVQMGGARLRGLSRLVTLAVFAQALLGGLAAGTDAGFAYNTWPLMDGGLIPGGLLAQSPAWTNFFENTATIQFQHRIGAYVVTGLIVWLWLRAVRDRDLAIGARTAVNWLVCALILQMGLGIATLLSVVWLPLAALHQAGALVLLTAALFTAHRMRAAHAMPHA